MVKHAGVDVVNSILKSNFYVKVCGSLVGPASSLDVFKQSHSAIKYQMKSLGTQVEKMSTDYKSFAKNSGYMGVNEQSLYGALRGKQSTLNEPDDFTDAV